VFLDRASFERSLNVRCPDCNGSRWSAAWRPRPGPAMLAPSCVAVPVSPPMCARSPDRPTPNIAPSWNVAPTDPLPVVRYYDTRAGERSFGCHALGARAVLGEGHQSRLREHQRQSRGEFADPCWREMDSNPRSPVRRATLFETPLSQHARAPPPPSKTLAAPSSGCFFQL
jgi:hypothetical protein